MTVLFANNATSRLASSLTAAATTLAVTTGDGAKFPSPSDGKWFPLTVLKSSGALEIMRCIARSGDVLTVTRAQESTAAMDFDAGDRVELRATAGVFAESQQRTAEAQSTADAAKESADSAYRKENILGTVSQSGGVPTGAIIERGSNANGEYVRFADGTQICTLRMTGGFAMGLYGSTGLYIGMRSLEYPAVFVNTPSISGVSTDQTNPGWVASNGVGREGAGVCHITASSTVTLTSIFILAIGRWY